MFGSSAPEPLELLGCTVLSAARAHPCCPTSNDRRMLLMCCALGRGFLAICRKPDPVFKMLYQNLYQPLVLRGMLEC